jgi:DNA invertase Pin-like site-specific DNA recombinase
MKLTPLVRVSTKEQEHDSQWVSIKRFADHGGHTLTTAVPVKASAFKSKSALGPAIDKLLAGKPEAVIVAHLDRATRGGIFAGGGDLVRKFRDARVPLFVADYGQDIASIDDLVLAAMIDASNRESRMKSQRTSDNHKLSADNGSWSGKALFGYSIEVLTKHNRKLVIKDSEASQVREAFALAGKGWSIPVIANALGWPVPSTGWRLHHSAYWTGETTFTSKRDGLSWVHAHPAIVTPGEAATAHANLALRRKHEGPQASAGTKNFEGVLHCGKCDSRMYLRTPKRNGKPIGTYYTCRAGHTSKQSVTESAVNAAVSGYAVAQMAPAVGPEAAELAAARAELAELGRDLANADITRVIELQGTVKRLESKGAGESAPRPTGAVYAALWVSGDAAQRRAVLAELHVTALSGVVRIS